MQAHESYRLNTKFSSSAANQVHLKWRKRTGQKNTSGT
jgi:hypothetical protein